MTRPPAGDADPGPTRPVRRGARATVERRPGLVGREQRTGRERGTRREQGTGRDREPALELAPLRASSDPIDAPRSRTRAASGATRPDRPDRTTVRRRSRLGGFLATYGWRAYAVPSLVVVTVLAVVNLVSGASPSTTTSSTTSSTTAAESPAAAPTGTVGSGTGFGSLETGTAGPDVIGESPAGEGEVNGDLATGALPGGGAFPETGRGTWHVVAGTTGTVGTGSVSTSTYTVEVEDGMDTTAFGGDEGFASLVDDTLADPRSWTGDGRFALQRIDSGTPTFRVSLTSQMTVRPSSRCGYSIELESSCFNRGEGRVLINVARWVRGALTFEGDVGSYRQYLVNHEVGHAIGFRAHQPCQSQGGLAPTMMQQTFSTSNDDIAGLDPGGVVRADGLGCRANAWPFPGA